MTTTTSPSRVETAAEQAFQIHQHAAGAAEQWRKRGEDLAKIIYGIRTIKIGGKYVWEWMGHDSEQAYFAAPIESSGLDLGWRMVNRYFGIHQDINVICGITPEMTAGVDRDKLDLARKLLVKDGQRIADEDRVIEVLSEAKAQSRSDFRTWVNEQAGITPPAKPVAATSTSGYERPLLDINNEEKLQAGGEIWFNMHKNARCCLKPWLDGHRAHVPVSKGAGGKEWKFCVLPINDTDHLEEQHREGIETWIGKKENHQGLFRYLYSNLFVLLEENRRLEEQNNAKENHP